MVRNGVIPIWLTLRILRVTWIKLIQEPWLTTTMLAGGRLIQEDCWVLEYQINLRHKERPCLNINLRLPKKTQGWEVWKVWETKKLSWSGSQAHPWYFTTNSGIYCLFTLLFSFFSRYGLTLWLRPTRNSSRSQGWPLSFSNPLSMAEYVIECVQVH